MLSSCGRQGDVDTCSSTPAVKCYQGSPTSPRNTLPPLTLPAPSPSPNSHPSHRGSSPLPLASPGFSSGKSCFQDDPGESRECHISLILGGKMFHSESKAAKLGPFLKQLMGLHQVQSRCTAGSIPPSVPSDCHLPPKGTRGITRVLHALFPRQGVRLATMEGTIWNLPD